MLAFQRAWVNTDMWYQEMQAKYEGAFAGF